MHSIRLFCLWAACTILTASKIYAQIDPVKGVIDQRSPVYAITGAYLHIKPGVTIANGTLVVKEGKILAAGSAAPIPKNAIVLNMPGKHIYPSFIELFSHFGMPDKSQLKMAERDQLRKGLWYWNESLRPEQQAHHEFIFDDEAADDLRNAGFGTVLTHPSTGVIRGTGAVVSLQNQKRDVQLIKANAMRFLSFRKGKNPQDYPQSLTGTIALIRQFLYDARWYANQKNTSVVYPALASWNAQENMPIIWEVQHVSDVFRAQKIAKEFGLNIICKGNGDEYQWAEQIGKTKIPIVMPLQFPQPYDVSDPLDAQMASLSDLKHWEMAPFQPYFLDSAGVQFAFTVAGKKSKFFKHLVTLRKTGYPVDKIVEALTISPAKLAGIEAVAGTLEPGKWASFLIFDQPFLDTKGFNLLENWVQGMPYRMKAWSNWPALDGVYTLNCPTFAYVHAKKVVITGKHNAWVGKLHLTDTTKFSMDIKQDEASISTSFYVRALNGFIRMFAQVDAQRNWVGTFENPKGEMVPFQLTFTAPQPTDSTEKDSESDTLKLEGRRFYPFKAFGKLNPPTAPTEFIIKNATVWTNTTQGNLALGDVWVKDGKIWKVGSALDAPSSVMVIDGSGKYLTSGIIDEHSHIALTRGVNEGGQSITAEVRMSDVIASDDINIYRQLSGGVVAAQLLHGSANAIGGQSALVKLKWGVLPDEMIIADAPGFIKFALGENVKQSNWGEQFTYRYPQSRMGVEQIITDAFDRALVYAEYKKQDKNYRVDLELEALLEIIQQKRFITCHSYVQSEILMLMRVAEKYGFRVNTFTHILEGYKVADEMAKHGAGASTFSDWWAYKMEVADAIPFNAAIMARMGIVTAINSDDAEMGRRLNQEAAKVMKYGGISMEEAWKMVTLNPAKLLRIDYRTGSISPGKDADLVLWSEMPLSIYAKAEKTWVEGVLYFDITEDTRLQQAVQTERMRLIQKMLQAKKDGENTVPVNYRQPRLYHCEDFHTEDE